MESDRSFLISTCPIEQVLYTEEQLHSRVREVGEQIAADYAGREPMLISVLRGSYIFMADLTRAINLNVTVDFMAPSRRGRRVYAPGFK